MIKSLLIILSFVSLLSAQKIQLYGGLAQPLVSLVPERDVMPGEPTTGFTAGAEVELISKSRDLSLFFSGNVTYYGADRDGSSIGNDDGVREYWLQFPAMIGSRYYFQDIGFAKPFFGAAVGLTFTQTPEAAYGYEEGVWKYAVRYQEEDNTILSWQFFVGAKFYQNYQITLRYLSGREYDVSYERYDPKVTELRIPGYNQGVKITSLMLTVGRSFSLNIL